MAQAIALSPDVAEYHSDFGLSVAKTGDWPKAGGVSPGLELRE